MGEQSEGRDTSAAPLTFPESPLLRAKLRAPEPPPHFVVRGRLHDLLDELVESPLTLVVAPAGGGKTQLLAGWMAAADGPCAWLSVDEMDRDATQLWLGVMTAIDSLAPGCCEHAASQLRRSGRSQEVVTELLNDLEAADAAPPFGVLIIDDAHLIDDDELARSFGPFMLHLPAWLHVVWSCRRVPDLPIDRLRARGQLAEIRFAELRFSEQESSELLARVAPSIPEHLIPDIAAGADGWAVGLQMAALATRANRAQPATGLVTADGESLIDDFVWHEVLASEPSDLVDVLLDICIVDRVNASLAAALTGRDDAGGMLAQAEARGLFVSRLGVTGWFRIHSLVKAALRAELARRSQGRLEEQHARAARWFQHEGEVAAALEHWLLARRYRDALHLLAAKHSELYDSGREATVVRTIASIPVSEGTADLESLLEYAWVHLLVDRRAFIDTVQRAAWWIEHQPREPETTARLTMLRSIAAMVEGDWIGCGQIARQALADYGDDWWRDPIGKFGWNMIARQLAYSESWYESADDVRDADLALSHEPERRAALEGTRALGLALAGQPVDALRTAAGVWRAADVSNMTILRAELQLAEAIAHRELGDRSRALEELMQIGNSPAETMLMCRVIALLELAEAHLDTYDIAPARQAFASAQMLVESGSMRGGVRERLARTGAHLALRDGDLVAAREWIDRIQDSFWGPVTAARVELAAGHRSEVAPLLDLAVPRCVRHEVVIGFARACSGEGDEASKHAVSALELAAANELLQTVATEGVAAVDMIERAAWRVPGPWIERLRRLLASGGGRPPTGSRELVEQLTDRERDVLRFLPSRLTVREIANELYISVNTLKFHLKVIYRKLGVTSRAEAAARARELLK